MTSLHLAWVLARVALAFGIALALARPLRGDPRSASRVWLACFLAPVLCLLPLPELLVPVLKPLDSAPALGSRVYELEPGFLHSKPVYLPDPGPGWGWTLFLTAAGLGLAVLGWKLFLTLRLVRAAEQLTDDDLLAELYELAQHHGMSDAPILKRSDAIDSPCAWGFVQPVILVPSTMELSAGHWRLVLEHELLHIRHRDPLWLLVSSVVAYGLWWNPLVWLAMREYGLAREQLVDLELSPNREYRELLAQRVRARPHAALSRFFGQGHLLTRIRAISRAPAPRSWSNRLAWAALLPALWPIRVVAPYLPDPERIGYDEIVYCRADDESKGPWRMHFDGRNPQPLPDFAQGAGTPSISPDGLWMSFSRPQADGTEDLFVARIDGSDERRVVSTLARDIQPQWSPEGGRLAFCTKASGSWELGVADLATGKWRLITRDGKGNLEPSWHPNGRRLVFSSNRTGEQKLWSMNLDGTGLVQLTFARSPDTHGTYSSDGRYLYYASFRRVNTSATRLDLATGEVQPLLEHSHLDTGEVDLIAGDTAVAMTYQDGTLAHIATVDLRDFSLRVIPGTGQRMWPAAR